MTNLFCRLEVDDEFKLRRLLYRQVGRFRSFENFVYVVGGLSIEVIVVHAVGHETALIDKLLRKVNSRQAVFDGKVDDALSFGDKGASGGRHNRLNLFLLRSLKGAL